MDHALHNLLALAVVMAGLLGPPLLSALSRRR